MNQIPELEPKRPLSLSILIVLLAVASVQGVWVAVAERATFLKVFSGATGEIYSLYLISGCAVLFCLWGLWRMRSWALPSLLVLSVAVGVLDWVARAPLLHALANVTAFLLVVIAGKSVLPYLLRGIRRDS